MARRLVPVASAAERKDLAAGLAVTAETYTALSDELTEGALGAPEEYRRAAEGFRLAAGKLDAFAEPATPGRRATVPEPEEDA